jgi:hypothetical protein
MSFKLHKSNTITSIPHLLTYYTSKYFAENLLFKQLQFMLLSQTEDLISQHKTI